MEARALRRLMQMPRAIRLDVIADGLVLLAEHIERLGEGLRTIAAAGDHRAGAVLRTVAEEEAAKVFVLLDLVRLGFDDDRKTVAQIANFYSHLARSIYVDVVEMSPATFGEVRARVEQLRRSHYLDGPSDADWVFRNELLARREETIYVDYVAGDDGARWISPAAYDDTSLGFVSPRVVTLVGAMHRLGLTRREGLGVIAAQWQTRTLNDTTHWQEIRQANADVVEELGRRGLYDSSATTADASQVVELWTFPLGHFSLKEEKVDLDELREVQRVGFGYE